MKQMKWPRPPLVLGFVLGALIERYMFISFNRYGFEWLSRPIVVVILAFAVMLIISPVFKHWKTMGGFKGIAGNMSAPQFRWPDLMHVFVLAVLGYLVVTCLSWPDAAKVGPLSIGVAALVLCGISLLNQVFSRAIMAHREASGEVMASHTVHMDTEVDWSDMTGVNSIPAPPPSSAIWSCSSC